MAETSRRLVWLTVGLMGRDVMTDQQPRAGCSESRDLSASRSYYKLCTLIVQEELENEIRRFFTLHKDVNLTFSKKQI